MENKIIHIKPKEDYRLVAISDIHGHLDMLKGLIDKVQLRDEDYLVILGDFVNKGPDSIGTYEYVRQLGQRKNTVVLKGNHESFMHRPLLENDRFDEVVAYLQTDPYETILQKFALASEFDFYGCESSDVFRDHLLSHYEEAFNYLDQLPILMYFDKFLFVHGGFNEKFKLPDDETRYLKYDFYDEIAERQKQPTVVGHFPTCIIRENKMSNLPFFNEEKNIISIDGGIGVKATGELNAFVIERRAGMHTFDCIQQDVFEEVVITKTHDFESEPPVYVRWPHKTIEVLEKGDTMTRCRHVQTGKEFTVFNSLIVKKQKRYELKTDYANNFMNLSVGTTVKKCKVFEDCVLVKHKDDFGWIHPDQIE